MKIKYSVISLIIMLTLFVSGFVLILRSTSMGQSYGQKVIHANGGSMDTEQYYGVINHSTENYRIVGILISMVGGVGILLCGCGIYKEI